MIAEERNEGKTVHFASSMDICHLKNSELDPQFQKYKGRVALRGDIVKDDSGSYAVFTEQGSSSSQMTAAKVMDIFRDYRDAQDEQQTHGQNHGPVWKTVVPRERNLYGHPPAGLSWERQFESQIGNAYSLDEKKDRSYQFMWTILKWQDRNKTLTHFGKYS